MFTRGLNYCLYISVYVYWGTVYIIQFMFTRGLCTRRAGMYKSVYNCARAGTQTIIIISRCNKLLPHFRFFSCSVLWARTFRISFFLLFRNFPRICDIYLNIQKNTLTQIFFVNVSLHVYFSNKLYLILSYIKPD